MASSLPEELLQEIFVHLPADEPVHLARASIVCKAWRRVLSDQDCFLRRCHEFHGSPPLLGFIQNTYNRHCSPKLTIRFSPAISDASPVRLPAVNCSGWCALDCRHGRVLIHTKRAHASTNKQLIIWDPITGSVQHLSVPAGRNSSYKHYYVGTVLCAKDGCNHLGCHGHSGPFTVVFLENGHADPNVFTCASIVYSSETKTWSTSISNCTNRHRFNRHAFSDNIKPNLLIGRALYFLFEHDNVILNYDLHAHVLSNITMPQVPGAILMMAEDGGLGLASLWDNCIYLWSRQDFSNGIAEWVQYRVMELVRLLPRCVPYELCKKAIGFVEGTNIIFIHIPSGIFTLDLKSKKMRQIVGQREAERFDPMFSYTSFYAPR